MNFDFEISRFDVTYKSNNGKERSVMEWKGLLGLL